MSGKSDSISNSFDTFYNSTKINVQEITSTIKNYTIFFGKNYYLLKDIIVDSIIDLVTTINKFLEENSTLLTFGLCTLFAYKYAFLRFTFTAFLTFVLENKNQQPPKPIISSNNLALNIIGAVGLLLHKISYPLSNPFFYLAPMLSGYSFAKTMYALYRDFYPLQQIS